MFGGYGGADLFAYACQVDLIGTVSASVFTHAGPLHLAGNLLLVAACWPAVADALGRCRASALIILAGAAGNTMAAVLIGRPVIGASAAAVGTLAAALVLRPRGRLAGLPIIPGAVAWLAVDLLLGTLGPTFAGIAWPAHLIGAALGALGAHALRRSAISSQDREMGRPKALGPSLRRRSAR